MNRNSVEEQYNSMSYFYNVLYSGCDMKDYEDDFINEYEDLLNSLQSNSKILDSSCGNGIQATALKRKGFNVIGTDISKEMINLTQQYAKSNNLFFPTKQLSWEQLPYNFDDEFDVVFCCGNSISHSMGKDEMLNNIRSLYKVTKNGGKIIIDTRNWDKVIKENVRFKTSDIKRYNDRKYIFTYIWNLNGFDESSNVEILFIEIANDKETKCIPFRLDFTPFKHDDFIKRLKECGLNIVKDNFQLDNDNYSVILEK
ncbi:class I SAM-dependent methyltransferase [Crassaminicella thermophila]|uniref:Class I SAM-dependent methyltransferase n=1 Tax=Crassaminicella thermophila TaxID=2599308 RepID=A0A5C0SH03_CRATE|nr:class I SAM-dependent methyltransferase [Crassaminicella thermophila]QEK13006.1 class I SAM-dependent methyltransferase [Crassaminicella thermophila]